MGTMANISHRTRHGSRAIIDSSDQYASVSLVNAPLRFMLNESTRKITAVATRDIDAEELELPPCAPGASSKLSKDATRPNAIPIQIEENHVHMSAERKKRMLVKTPEGTPAASSTIKTITHTFYVLPDTKLPSWETLLDTAVAGGRRAMKPLDGKEVMHPFFLVPRVTEKELKARNDESGTKAKFNLDIKKISLGVVTTGSLMKKKPTSRGRYTYRSSPTANQSQKATSFSSK